MQERDDFPKELLPIISPKEDLNETKGMKYQWFMHYLIQGPQRTKIGVANAFRKPGTPTIPSNMTNRNAIERAKANGSNCKTMVPPLYTKVRIVAGKYHWDSRAEIWDAYIAMRSIRRTANLVTIYGEAALHQLFTEMKTAPHAVTRIQAASKLADKAVPNISEKNVNVNFGSTSNASEEELFKIVKDGALKKQELIERERAIAELPAVPSVAKLDSSDTIEGEFSIIDSSETQTVEELAANLGDLLGEETSEAS